MAASGKHHIMIYYCHYPQVSRPDTNRFVLICSYPSSTTASKASSSTRCAISRSSTTSTASTLRFPALPSCRPLALTCWRSGATVSVLPCSVVRSSSSRMQRCMCCSWRGGELWRWRWPWPWRRRRLEYMLGIRILKDWSFCSEHLLIAANESFNRI